MDVTSLTSAQDNSASHSLNPASEPTSQQNHVATGPGHYHDQLSASTVALHGLAALEAATADTHDANDAQSSARLAQQAQHYAQSAALHMREAFGPQQPSPPEPQQQAPQQLPPVGYGAPPAVQMPHHPAPSTVPKTTRLRRACDMCSSRKVKCDNSGPPCKPCRDLGADCTFHRETKRRGPPNKHAEAQKAAKRNRLDGGDFSPTPQNAAEVLVSIAGHDGTGSMDAEAIAPWPVLTLLVDDFFTYMHPLMPFPHEPSFRHAFHNRADQTSPQFLALLASMIGVLVASFPRSARAHLKASHSTNLFPTAMTMISRCRDVALRARGAFYLTQEEISMDDAATSYFLAVAGAYTLQNKLFKRYMMETMTFCREFSIFSNRRSESDMSNVPAFDDKARQVNCIEDQICKRIFWVMVTGLRSVTQLGVSINEIPLPPPTAKEPYPDMPMEVDDEYITAERIYAQPENTMPLITGFLQNVKIYLSMNELTGIDMCYGISFFEWTAQKTMLYSALQAAKNVTNHLPVDLQVKVESGYVNGGNADPDDAGLQYYPPAYPAAQPANDVRAAFAAEPYRRRKLQLEIQKANIHISQLASRSYFVERYLNLRDAHRSKSNHAESDIKDETDMLMVEERELIVRNLLTVLTSITQRNMEPNGASIISKIRQIASTLLNDAPERKGPVAIKMQDYLDRFLDILLKLEKSGTNAGSLSATMTSREEEEELQHWASLRDYQMLLGANENYSE